MRRAGRSTDRPALSRGRSAAFYSAVLQHSRANYLFNPNQASKIAVITAMMTDITTFSKFLSNQEVRGSAPGVSSLTGRTAARSAGDRHAGAVSSIPIQPPLVGTPAAAHRPRPVSPRPVAPVASASPPAGRQLGRYYMPERENFLWHALVLEVRRRPDAYH